MMWWKVFAAGWNGESLIIHRDSKEYVLTSDASGSWGCVAWHGSRWFQIPWDKYSQRVDPNCSSGSDMGHLWKEKSLSDNIWQ